MIWLLEVITTKNYSENEIAKLQNNLLLIRKAGGWSAEEFGDMIGVTKQTISNLENKKTTMTKTQYIAIRAVLDYEMAAKRDNKVLASAVNLSLNSENLSDVDVKKAQAFIEGATKTGLDNEALDSGLSAMIGAVAAKALIMSLVSAVVFDVDSDAASDIASSWLAKIIKNKK